MNRQSDVQAVEGSAARGVDVGRVVDAVRGVDVGRVVDVERVAAVREAMPSDRDVADVADVFGLLSDPGRLRLMAALLGGELCVGDLAAAAGLSESAASHALRILRAHRVVSVRRSGRMAYYALADAHVRMLLDLALAHIAHIELAHDHPGADGA